VKADLILLVAEQKTNLFTFQRN